MARPQTLAVLALSTVTALAAALPTAAVADQPAPPPPSGAVAAEYVVSSPSGARAVRSAVAAAGGEVVDFLPAVGLAKVRADDADFLAKVRRQPAVEAAGRNGSVGTTKPGMPHQWVQERPAAADLSQHRGPRHGSGGSKGAEPLAPLQWGLAMLDADRAHRKATGKGTQVGIIDSGIDASHPDLARNFDRSRSRNFTTDIPAVDGPCEVTSCVDPADTDDNGHGTHVAGIVAADDNGLGMQGVAPDARLVNLRAGQDSGYFFLYETVAALVAAGTMKLDAVNMSFYTDPWLFNCASRADYLSGTVTGAEIAEQAMTRKLLLSAVTFAHRRGVTLVGSAGNNFTDLAAPTRTDASSPDHPAGAARERVVTKNCLVLPGEAPQVISVTAVGPSSTKADYSSYGFGAVEIAAPGGWLRDGIGTPTFQTPGNMVLSAYPLHAAIAKGLADADGNPTSTASVRSCTNGVCGFYTYLQGTSMAAPHVTGVAALVVDRHGHRTRDGRKALNPDRVRRILERSAVDHACPAGGTEVYTDEGRSEAYNAVCEGTTRRNGLYGEGIVNADRALRN
jgi:subtilisin family serine protease